jgi:hypothetical protein
VNPEVVLFVSELVKDAVAFVVAETAVKSVAKLAHGVSSAFNRKGFAKQRPQIPPTGRQEDGAREALLGVNRRNARKHQNTSDHIASQYHQNVLLKHQDIIKKSPFLSQNYRSLMINEERRIVDNKRYALDVERAKAENKRIDLSHGDHPSRISANTRFNSKRSPSKPDASGKGGGILSGLDMDASTLIGGALFGGALDLLSEFDFSDEELNSDATKILEDFKSLVTNFNGDKGILKSSFAQLFQQSGQ